MGTLNAGDVGRPMWAQLLGKGKQMHTLLTVSQQAVMCKLQAQARLGRASRAIVFTVDGKYFQSTFRHRGQKRGVRTTPPPRAPPNKFLGCFWGGGINFSTVGGKN